MDSQKVAEKPPIRLRNAEINLSIRSGQDKSFPESQDSQEAKSSCVKRHSTCGIDRPLTPAKVSADKGANRLSLCSNLCLDIDKEGQTKETKAPYDVTLAPRKTCDDHTTPSGSIPTVASASTVILRRKPVRQPRPTSMFIQSECKKPPLIASKSYDADMFFSSLSSKSVSNSQDDVRRTHVTKMSCESSLSSLFSRGNSLPRTGDLRIGNPVKKLNAIFRKDKSGNSKGVVLRKKKDNPKDSSQKANFRKSLPVFFATKSVPNFNMIKNPFSRSLTAKDFPELPIENDKNMVFYRRQSLPSGDHISVVEQKNMKGGRKTRTHSIASQSLSGLLNTQGNLLRRRRNKAGNYK